MIMNLVKLAEQSLEKMGEITTDVFNGIEFTNYMLIKSANKLANGLIRCGIKPGDKIVVMLMNSPEVLICYQAISRAGAIIIPVIPHMKPNEVANIIKSSKARAIITSKDFMHIIKYIKENTDTLKHVILVDNKEINDTVSLERLVEKCSYSLPDIQIHDDDIAALIYTSGTTGEPKGVILTHNNLCENVKIALNYTKDLKANSSIDLIAVPVCGFFGIGALNSGFSFPTKRIIMSYFELEQACQLVERYKITSFSLTPSILSHIVNNIDIVKKYDLSSLTNCISGGAAMPVKVRENFESQYKCIVYESYGITEASGTIAFPKIGCKRKSGSVGKVVSGLEVKIVDNQGNEMPNNEQGELIVKGPTISPGYYNMPEETIKVFKEGWLHTGDIARIDDEGFVYIVDRKKNLIITNGLNVVPRDVEEVIYQHPLVDETMVIGSPDEEMGEKVKAIVVTKNRELNENDIISHCRKYLAEYKCPKYVQFVDYLPRNANGKILRKKY
jgi:long-chain acyl-CoA synthetase